MTIYLIDDDNDDLDLFSEAVSVIDKKIRCMKSNDSEAALKSFRLQAIPLPDLIFLDLNMPLVSGRELLRELKQIKAYADVPVIIYSTSTHPKDMQDTRNLGASSFLPKPYSLRELVELLKEVLFRDWTAPANDYSKKYYFSRY